MGRSAYNLEDSKKMVTLKLLLETSYDLSESGRVLRTREPNPRPGPRFVLQRSSSDCAWALRSDIPEDLAAEVGRLAQDEPPASDLRLAPIHAEKYLSLLGGEVDWGPTFLFPAETENPYEGVVPIDDLSLLQGKFSGWTAAEIPHRLPIMAVLEGRHAVSVCFSAGVLLWRRRRAWKLRLRFASAALAHESPLCGRMQYSR